MGREEDVGGADVVDAEEEAGHTNIDDDAPSPMEHLDAILAKCPLTLAA